jgi:hypothetical protein
MKEIAEVEQDVRAQIGRGKGAVGRGPAVPWGVVFATNTASDVAIDKHRMLTSSSESC